MKSIIQSMIKKKSGIFRGLVQTVTCPLVHNVAQPHVITIYECHYIVFSYGVIIEFSVLNN